MERELKKVALSIVMMEDKPRVNISAYTTPVGGLVVAPLHEIVWSKTGERIVKRQRNWCIWTYPVGLRLLGGFPEKQQAVDFSVQYLAKYSWVALVKDDILKNNDMDAMRKDFMGYRKLIADTYK